MTISIEQQIACVRRELALRKNVYPKWVASKRMKQEAADHEIAALQAVHDTLTASSKISQIADLLHRARHWFEQFNGQGDDCDFSNGEEIQPLANTLEDDLSVMLTGIGALP